LRIFRRFLDPVFAQRRNPGRERQPDPLDFYELRNRDDGYVIRAPTGFFARPSDFFIYYFQIVFYEIHVIVPFS